MWEVMKEFICVVIEGIGEEISRAGSGIVVSFFCMLAFLCILVGIFIESRCARIYYVAAGGKRKLLGNIYFRNEEGCFKVKIPEHFLEKSESIYYCIEVPKDFAHRHYMEELQLELPAGRKKMAIKKHMQFKSGLQIK